MVTVPTSTIEKISHLTEEQLIIVTALVEEFTKKPNADIDVSKRIGIAKGKFSVSKDFDDIDFNTSELFGIL